MSSLEMNKIAAAVLTAGLVAMASGFVADLLVPAHDEEGEKAYPIQVAEGGDGAAPAEAEEPGLEPVLPLLASADPAAGESLTRACAACHSFEQGGPNKVGPNLWGIVGAPHAHVEDFAYSDALAAMSDKPWTYEELNAFLADPKEYAPGTKMSYAGMSDVEDRADLIAYLRSLSESPEPLPTEEEIQAVTGGDDEAAEDAAEDAAAEETGEGAAADAAEQAGDMAADAAEQAGDMAEDAAEQAGDMAEDAAGAAQEAAEAAGDAAEEAAEAAAGAVQQASADGQPEYLQMIAAADPADGEKQVRVCAACHSFDEGGPNKVGPNLWNVVGQPVAHLDSYNYSKVFEEKREAGVTWTYENLWAYLKNPREWAPGTKMSFAGVRKEEDKAAIIAYLRSLAAEPAPLEPLQ